MKKLKANINLLLIAVVLLIGFILTYKYILPINFENLSGKHSWLSGSTIKFVNSWLHDGIAKLKFANVENPASIEFPTFMSRQPYVSYPTGSTFIVWIFAKLLGKTSIDIVYLKKFQCVLYFLEALCIAYASYILISNFSKTSRKIKTIVCIFISLFWIYLPANAWFLANVFFADQAVIFWILLSFLVENLETIYTKNNKILFVIKEIVILCGVLTDYYYWIYIFFICLFNFIRCLLINGKLSSAIKNSMQYVIPVVIGLCLYLIQMSFVDNWQTSLFSKFQERTGIVKDESTFMMIINKIAKNYAQESVSRLYGLIIFIILIIVAITIKTKLYKKIKTFFVNKAFNCLCALYVSTIMQMIILKNHSAIHEFSVVKIGILLTYFLVIVFIFAINNFGKKLSILSFIIVLSIISYIVGIPFFTRQRVLHENEKYESFAIEHTIDEITDYDDICYSFTYEIDCNPPEKLAVSNKRVYLIKNINDINRKIKNANYILIIEKEKELTEENEAQINEIMDTGAILFNDNKYCLVQLSNEK